MSVQEFNDITYDKDKSTGIVTIVLDSPERKNALSDVTFWELYRAFETIQEDDTAKAMIITGGKDPKVSSPEKEVFSSGGYFNPETGPIDENDPSVSQEAREQINFTDIAQKKLTLKMWEFDKPVVAAINGYAIGAGFTMPLAGADFIIASEHAWAMFPFVRLGILPEFASTFLLPRLLGVQRAKQILYLGEKLSADELLALGLINKVVPHEKLMSSARGMVLDLVPPKAPGFAMKLTKQALHKPLIENLKASLDMENYGLNKTFSSFDFLEGMSARKERRTPVYQGR